METDTILLKGLWRVGGKVPLNVYEGDRPMFQCHTPEDASRIVSMLNATAALESRLDVMTKLAVEHKEISEALESQLVEMAMQLPNKGERHSLQEQLAEARERQKWRPISELHEDYGTCVLINIDDPGHLVTGSNLDLDYDESKWTHFSRIALLGQKEYEEMIDAAGALRAKPEGWKPSDPVWPPK
jgi:hypothetical protein